MLKLLQSIIYLVIIINLTSFLVFGQQLDNSPLIYRVVNSNIYSNSDGHISIVNGLTLQELIRVPFNKPSFILEITPDQKRAFVTHDYNFKGQGLTVFDLERGMAIGTLFDDVMVTNVKIGTDGLLWVLLNDLRVVLINPNTLQTITTFTLSANPRSIVFSSDGDRAYVSLQSSQNINISIFDVKARRFIRNIFNLPAAMPIEIRPMELAISPDNRVLCYGARDTITVINTDSLSVINSFNIPVPSNFDIPSLLFSPDGNLLYVGQFNAFNISVFDFRSNQLTSIFNPIFNSTVQDFKLSSDGRLLYIGEFRGTIVFDIATRSVITFIERFNVSQSAIGGGLVIAGNFNIGQPPTVQVTNPLANQQLTPGQNVRIQWQTTVAAQSFALANHRVELSTNGGQTFSTIAGAENLTADAREFTWIVPNIQVANNAQIRVTAGDLGARRGSSASGNFSIGMGGGNPGDTQAPTVNFIAPMGGENFNSGSNLAISWMSNDNVGWLLKTCRFQLMEGRLLQPH
ncbi:MAG: beta-propeller fold lactonase family protein [Blastocatellia bacterium]|nr:beta-propeller fold lactonase family protein [Blastocatellia bacterium]